jgi:hypothetical protein
VLQSEDQGEPVQHRFTRIQYTKDENTAEYYAWAAPTDRTGDIGKAWLHAMRGNNDARHMGEVRPFLYLGEKKLSWALSLDHAEVGNNTSRIVRGGF